MKQTKSIFCVMITAVLMLPLSKVTSQTSISLSQNLSYFSNSFYNSTQLPDLTDQIGWSFSHFFEGEKIQSQVYYQGDLNLFQRYSDRLFHDHSFGYDGYSVSPNETKTLYFGSNLFWHNGQQEYNAYDYWKLQGYINSKIYLRDNLISRFGYILNHKSYAKLSEFSYWEHMLFVQLNTFFQTRTSITLSFNYGMKDYIPLVTSTGTGRGRQIIVDSSEMPSVDQLISNVKLAQSLGMKTSLSFDYLNRFHPGLAGGSAVVMNNQNLFTEDELFDDRYGYQGHEISVMLTHYLPAYIKLQLGGSRLWKNYLNRAIYDTERNIALTGATRVDNRYLGWIELSRTVAVKWGIKSLSVSLQGGYLKNDSNDSYYRFDNYFSSIGLELKLK